ncbi:hypothetical protein [Mycoplasmopsis bovis]|uniref:hypothetical protein n=1 Tax=Mycoplasmopsis bovis TaxID=28903 RepID=UPI001FB51C12
MEKVVFKSLLLSSLFNIINVINGGINIAKLNKSQINNINLSLFTFLTILELNK